MNITITTTTQELPLQKRRPRLQRTKNTWAFISTVILIGFSCCISTTSAVYDSLLVHSAEDSSSSSPRNISSTTTATNEEPSSFTSPEHPQQEETFVKGDANFFNAVTRKTQEVACLNNPLWVYSGPLTGGGVVSNNGNTETAVDCLSLYQTSSEAQRVEFCQMEEVRLHCPLTCGLCCEDDPTFLFPRFNGRYAGCGWLSGNQVRIDNNCDLLYSGTYVWSACPLTCGRCPAYVNLSPSTQPSDLPSSSPTHPPSHVPSSSPTHPPSHVPSVTPTHPPSRVPSVTPTHGPPTLRPSAFPSQSETPSNEPSSVPTMVPTTTPTALPTVHPTSNPTKMPSVKPSASPSREPSRFPTLNPSTHPSLEPTLSPTSSPSAKPSTAPSGHPSDKPSLLPSSDPTPSPSNMPSRVPTVSPSNHPTQSPSTRPSVFPSKEPSASPSDKPSARPSIAPSSRPTAVPTEVPTNSPTSSIKPSPTPTTVPSASPTLEPSTQPSSSPTSIPPNLVFLLTDEQNFRTLSCYRDYLLSQYNMSSVDVWGDNLSVLTPNIDSLAKDGALFTHFYTSSPLCTPARGTFMTGMYPPFTGTTRNRGELDPNLKTWADILREERGYRTSYMGKWHLDGDAKPGVGAPAGRDFGFDDNKYRYNRGHWKYFDEINGSLQVYKMSEEANFAGRLNEHFSTDFLMDRGIEFIEGAVSDEKPFALTISFPDPHSPNQNRPYFRNMYNDLEFSVPETGKMNLKFDPAPPAFNKMDKIDVGPDEIDQYFDEYEQIFFSEHMRQYYGMVKCIDFNVGKLLEKLKALGVDDNTIIVFTSDHGGMKLEHGIMNKNAPYEASAGIPFIVKYPDRVPAGKVIDTAHSSVDFAPTILSMMGISELPSGVNFQGIDASPELMNSDITSNNDHITFSFETGNTPHWAAAIKKGYKLVLSDREIPWLFDLNKDPDEMINFATSSWHQAIFEELRDALIGAFTTFEIPVANEPNVLFLDVPACNDSRDVLPINNGKTYFCTDIGTSMPIHRCDNQEKIRDHCPVSCKTCCQDSPGKIWINSSERLCSSLENFCGDEKVRQFCPVTCNAC